MNELEQAARLLGQLVNVSLQNTFTDEAEVAPTEEPPLPVGQYL